MKYRILKETLNPKWKEGSEEPRTTFEPTGETVKGDPQARLDELQAETGICHAAEAV